MKPFRKLVIALFSLAIIALSPLARAEFAYGDLKITTYSGMDIGGANEHWYEGTSHFDTWPNNTDGFVIGYFGVGVKLNGNAITVMVDNHGSTAGGNRCGQHCWVHIESLTDKIKGATLDQASINFGFSNKLSLNSFYDPTMPGYIDPERTGLWMNFNDGFPPNDEVTVTLSTVPEPETYAMLLGGLGLMGFVLRRQKQV